MINKIIYLVIGLTQEGKKQVLGMWISENESASFWMTVLSDLKARGVKDILIASTDNLNGFTESNKGVFPDTVTQIWVVHQIRNSLRYVVRNEKKEFAADINVIYRAATLEAVELALATSKRNGTISMHILSDPGGTTGRN